MKFNFWTWLKNYAAKKEREKYLQKQGYDFKCPHCNTWQGNCGGSVAFKHNYPDSLHDAYACGHCGRWVILNCMGMFAEVSYNQKPAKKLEPVQPNDPENLPQLFRT